MPIVSRAVWLSLTLATLGVGCGSDGSRTPVTSQQVGSTTYGLDDVRRAFGDVGIKLYNRGIDNEPAAIASEISTSRRYLVVAWLFHTVSAAREGFAINDRKWRSSGMATVLRKNLIVVVRPPTARLGVKAPPWPMPSVVTRAVAKLP
jgi:hypothetical protein